MDEISKPVDQIAQVPEKTVETVQSVPEVTIKAASDVSELPHTAIHQTLNGLTEATRSLTEAANSLKSLAEHSVSKATEVVETPVSEGLETAQEVTPELEKPPTRFIRRHDGRKIKRNA